MARRASFFWAGHLYVVAGVENDATNTDHVRRAPITQEGTMGAWEDLPAIPKKHAHTHHTPVFGGFVYSAGGALNHASFADVFIGRLE